MTEEITVEYYRDKYAKKKNRFGNIAQRKKCALNHSHQSREEAEYCLVLQILKKSGEIKDFRSQVKYSLDLTDEFGKKHHLINHIVDFEVWTKAGKLEVHEYKGYETEIWRVKMRLFRFLYPHIPYIVKRKKDLPVW